MASNKKKCRRCGHEHECLVGEAVSDRMSAVALAREAPKPLRPATKAAARVIEGGAHDCLRHTQPTKGCCA